MSERAELPKNLIEFAGGEIVPALPKADISRLSALLEASPEEFAKAAGLLLRKLAIQGFSSIQAPRNYKELATTLDLLRKFEGMDSKDKGGALPAGLVRVLGSVQRRTVVDVEEVDPDPGFE